MENPETLATLDTPDKNNDKQGGKHTAQYGTCLPFVSIWVRPLFLGMVTFVQTVLIPQNTIEYMSNITFVL
jgi:hypothetical protein